VFFSLKIAVLKKKIIRAQLSGLLHLTPQFAASVSESGRNSVEHREHVNCNS